MMKNLGDIDRIVRMVGGGAVLFLFFAGPHTSWALLGLLPILTAFVGFCPIYKFLGMSTYPFDKAATPRA